MTTQIIKSILFPKHLFLTEIHSSYVSGFFPHISRPFFGHTSSIRPNLGHKKGGVHTERPPLGVLRWQGYADFIIEKGKGLFSHENKPFCVPFGGDKRDRTADLLNAIQALSQLSYTPIFFPKWKFIGYAV